MDFPLRVAVSPVTCNLRSFDRVAVLQRISVLLRVFVDPK